MPELEYVVKGTSVQPINERAYCPLPCGKELIAKDGYRNMAGSTFRHVCENFHSVEMKDVKYPRIKYIPTRDFTIETEVEHFKES